MFQLSYWEALESGELVYRFTDVDSHPCSEEELGLTGDNSKFYPLHETSLTWVQMYRKKFLCADPGQIEIHGNF